MLLLQHLESSYSSRAMNALVLLADSARAIDIMVHTTRLNQCLVSNLNSLHITQINFMISSALQHGTYAGSVV